MGASPCRSTIFAENCEKFWSNKLHDVKFHTLDDVQGYFKRPKVSMTCRICTSLEHLAPIESGFAVRYKLQMSLKELTQADPPIFTEGEDLIVTDPMLPTRLTLQLYLTD